MALIRLQRESHDWIPRTISQQGSDYTGDWSYQIVAYRARPTGTWLPAVVIGGVKGVEVLPGRDEGIYEIYYDIEGQGSLEPVLDPDRLDIR